MKSSIMTRARVSVPSIAENSANFENEPVLCPPINCENQADDNTELPVLNDAQRGNSCSHIELNQAGSFSVLENFSGPWSLNLPKS